MTAAPFVLLLNGTFGVGKSSVLDHVGDLLCLAGVSFALMDVDWFHRSWSPDDGADGESVETDNLRAVSRGYERVGPRQLVVSGVMRSRNERARYGDVFAWGIRSVRMIRGCGPPGQTGQNPFLRRTPDQSGPVPSRHAWIIRAAIELLPGRPRRSAASAAVRSSRVYQSAKAISSRSKQRSVVTARAK